MTAGGGDDLVVLEAGLGASGLYWGPVHRELAQHVRVVAYERAGYGASAAAREPVQAAADRLAGLHLTGAWWCGTGLAAVVAHATRTAAEAT